LSRQKKILVAPLNWGLGHATRCIPIIRSLLEEEVTVVVGADGRPLDLLKNEFPTLQFIQFPGLNISYAGNLTAGMIRQLPHVGNVTINEYRALKRYIDEFEIDAVISDNRFGLFSSKVPCVYVTHQIRIMMPGVLTWARSPVSRVQRALINRYNECWIPDFEGTESLSGELAHNIPLPRHTYYVGPLSRFQKYRDVSKKYDLIVVLSGPEPQRTMLEQMVRSQLGAANLKTLIVRGIPEGTSEPVISGNVSIVSHLTSKELNQAILASDVVLSRPGYSTIMDLAVLGSKAIFIPTPGQTEQEYLAALYHGRKIFYSEKQSDFDLARALEGVRDFGGFDRAASEISPLRERIRHLAASIA
jgi:uncharacterized protein (TIGR00661 family)